MTKGISNHLEVAKLCVADWDLWLLRSRSLETFLTLLGGSQFQSLQFSSQLVIIFEYVDKRSFWETFLHYSHPLLLYDVYGIYLFLFIAESLSLRLRPTMYPHLHCETVPSSGVLSKGKRLRGGDLPRLNQLMVEVVGSHSHDSVTTGAVGFQLDFDVTGCG